MSSQRPPARFHYQERGEFFAQCVQGLEAELAAELVELGARRPEPSVRGVRFSAEPAELEEICFRTRLATRVLAPLAVLRARDADELYRGARAIAWTALLDASDTFAFTVVAAEAPVQSSQFALHRVKDALVDAFQARADGRRPSVERREPDVVFHLHWRGERATVSLDAGGGPLSRRGYRAASGSAPLGETVAAAVIRAAGYSGDQPLVDPLCGTGTLLAEALMVASGAPAALLRARFGFERLPEHDRTRWAERRRTLESAIVPVEPGMISGNDLDPSAIAAAREGLARLPGGAGVRLTLGDFRALQPAVPGLVVTNPPWGERLGEEEAAERLVGDLGSWLKRASNATEAWLVLGSARLARAVGLRSAARVALSTGGREVRLCRYAVRPAGLPR